MKNEKLEVADTYIQTPDAVALLSAMPSRFAEEIVVRGAKAVIAHRRAASRQQATWQVLQEAKQRIGVDTERIFNEYMKTPVMQAVGDLAKLHG